MDEIELLRAAASSANAFAQLFQLHVTRVYRYHMAHVGTAKDAEDLTAQTFMAALEEYSSFHGRGSFAAWLMGIALKKRLHDLRGNRRELPIDAVLYYQSSGLPTERGAMQRREIETTTRALKQISPDHAEGVILTFFGELSISEVSGILKKSTTSTRTLISRGLQELRTHSALTSNGEITEDQGTFDSTPEYGRVAEQLTNLSSHIAPDPHFVTELEKTLVANHQPKAKRIFSLQQIASLAGWALLIAAGMFLLYWRAIPGAPLISPSISNRENATATAVIEAASGKATSSPSPTVRATATRLAMLEYTVQDGDTCTYIAERFGVTIDKLITVNDLNETCDIWIDQKLFVPISVTPTPKNN